jgi:small-conductance mechanosensitive channel
MPPGDLYIAAGFWSDHRDQVTAIATILLAIGLAMLVDRALAHRAGRLAAVVSGGELSATADTRTRLLTRLVFVAILLIGISFALIQFPAVKRTATGILASSAVLGLVIGFAARQTLANLVAGILLAITQPIRIGDLVQFEGESGVVEDVRLTYTYMRAQDGRRIIVPNERLASSTIQNFTIVDPAVEVEVTIGLPLDADPIRALESLKELGDVEVAAIEKDGYQVVVRTRADHPLERRAVAARIRTACLERLKREDLLGQAPPSE